MTTRPSSSPDPFVEEYFPSWNLRVNIGVEVATALNFLHTINKPKSLIHGDVKRYITMPHHMQSPSATTLLPLATSSLPPPLPAPLVPSSLPPPLVPYITPSPFLLPFITASSSSFSLCSFHHSHKGPLIHVTLLSSMFSHLDLHNNLYCTCICLLVCLCCWPTFVMCTARQLAHLCVCVCVCVCVCACVCVSVCACVCVGLCMVFGVVTCSSHYAVLA